MSSILSVLLIETGDFCYVFGEFLNSLTEGSVECTTYLNSKGLVGKAHPLKFIALTEMETALTFIALLLQPLLM